MDATGYTIKSNSGRGCNVCSLLSQLPCESGLDKGHPRSHFLCLVPGHERAAVAAANNIRASFSTLRPSSALSLLRHLLPCDFGYLKSLEPVIESFPLWLTSVVQLGEPYKLLSRGSGVETKPSLNVLVAGFMTIDRIELPMRTVTSVGGPPSYAGILCARFGLDVMAATRIGVDFPEEQLVWLARNGLQLRSVDRSETKKTTRFRLVVNGEDRSLFILERCEDITLEQIPQAHFDASLVSPLAQEISSEVFDQIRERSDFCFLDPQGFVRAFDGWGR